MSTLDVESLQRVSLRVREHVLRMSTNGGCFTGASLSCVDILVYLYTTGLRMSPSMINNPGRDYLFLSKGHDVPALYGTFAELGYIQRERLQQHLKVTDDIYWHPNRSIPGVEFHSGSLGHLLSVGMGVATDIRLRGGSNTVVVVVGDGECNEGSMWEGALVASAHGLSNLIVIVDRNAFQANAATEDLIPLEPFASKWESFGWTTWTVNGHDMNDLHRAYQETRTCTTPAVIIADTVRGKGVPSIERRADRWFCNFTAAEVEQLLKELHGAGSVALTSETLVVR
jgi:transketolase